MDCITKEAFLDELNKLAAGVRPGPIKKAVTSGVARIKSATITKLATIDIVKGKRIYRSKDEQPPDNKISDNSRLPYQLYSEDSAFGYKIAAFKPKGLLSNSGFPMPRLDMRSNISPIHKHLSTIGYRGTTARGSNKLTKIGSLKGRRYPSKAMKKEYDAANDSETIDLDSTTVFSPSYPTVHKAIQV